MARDLRPLGDWVNRTTWPNTPCPACGDCLLAVEVLVTVESAEPARWHDHENWDPDMVRGTFHGTLRCGLVACDEPVVVVGDFVVGPDLAADGSWFGGYDDFFHLRYAQPALPIVRCPDGTPDTVRGAAAAAARVVWTDPGSAANRLRLATEQLLTAQRIRRLEVVKGRRRGISAHRRLEECRKDNAPAGDALMAASGSATRAATPTRSPPRTSSQAPTSSGTPCGCSTTPRRRSSSGSYGGPTRPRGCPGQAVAAPRDRSAVLPRAVTSFFSDREPGATAPPPSADLNPGAWRGLCAVVRRRFDDGSLARDHPLTCVDKPLPYAVDLAAFHDEWSSLVPGLDLPLRADEPPPTPVAMDAVEWVARHVWTPQQLDFHSFMGHWHLRHHDRPAALRSFAADVNEVLSRNGVALRLTEAGLAERTGPAVVAARLHAWDRRTGDDTLDELLARARRRFLDPDPAERAEALKALWAAWERVKTVIDPDDKKRSAAALLDRAATHPDLRDLLETEARALTKIGNGFTIRHSETNQVQLETDAQADWLFSRLWALVELVAPAAP